MSTPSYNTALEEEIFKAAFHAELGTMAGRSYIDLGLLATDPKYQGKGAGKALLAQGLAEVVDKLGLLVTSYLAGLRRPCTSKPALS